MPNFTLIGATCRPCPAGRKPPKLKNRPRSKNIFTKPEELPFGQILPVKKEKK